MHTVTGTVAHTDGPASPSYVIAISQKSPPNYDADNLSIQHIRTFLDGQYSAVVLVGYLPILTTQLFTFKFTYIHAHIHTPHLLKPVSRFKPRPISSPQDPSSNLPRSYCAPISVAPVQPLPRELSSPASYCTLPSTHRHSPCRGNIRDCARLQEFTIF